jgi:hypothetical protein
MLPFTEHKPLLPLETWRHIIGFHPWHFWQLSNATIPLTSECNDLIRQYAWQESDAAGRSEVLEAISTAEQRLKDYLGYWPAPKYEEEEVQWERFYQRAVDNYSRAQVDGRWIGAALSSGYIRAVGTESLTAINATAAVTYSDIDGDGLDDTWTTGAIATTVTDVKKIAVYFAAADRWDGSGVSDSYRIAPVQVLISGGFVTVKGRRWQVVKPVKYEGANVGNTDGAFDPTDDANFVTTVAVYERTTDPAGTTTATAQAKFIWETRPWPYWAACCDASGVDNSTDPAATAEGVGRVTIRDAVLGIVGLGAGVYNATTGVWASAAWEACHPPDRVIVRYLAGYPLDGYGQMASQWRTIVARMAAAELPKPRCDDSNGNRNLFHWQFDLARAKGQLEEQYQISPADLDNPFGTRRGHVYAWKQVQNLKTVRGISV